MEEIWYCSQLGVLRWWVVSGDEFSSLVYLSQMGAMVSMDGKYLTRRSILPRRASKETRERNRYLQHRVAMNIAAHDNLL